MKRVALVVVLSVVLGVVGAKLWLWWWTPPIGVAYHHSFQQDALGLQRDFDGTGWYVAVVMLLGLVIGLAGWVAARGLELVTAATCVAGSLLAAWLTRELGLRWGPASPDPTAGRSPDLTPLHAGLTVVDHLGVLLMGPLTTALVLAIGLLALGRRWVRPDPDPEPVLSGTGTESVSGG